MSAALPVHGSLSAALRLLAQALDPVLWARDALGFEAEPWQASVLRSTAPRVALNCTRQAGKSTIAAVLALHGATHAPGSLVLLAAPSLRQSGELHRKVHAFIDRLNPRPQLAEDSSTTVALPNGSRIACIPSTEATSRGFSSPRLVVLDEAARIPDEAVAALRPMLAGGGRMLQLSTPAGQRGHFHDCATLHRDDWEWHEVRAADISRISPDFLAAERRALGPRAFAQEYECSFEAVESALFDVDQVRACLSEDVLPLFHPGGAVARLADLLSTRSTPLGMA